MLVWYVLSIIWSINVSYTIHYLFYIVCGLSIVLTLIYYLKDLQTQEKLFKILSIVFIIEITFSLLEAFTDFRLPISPFSQYISYFGRSMKIDTDLDMSIVSIVMQSPTGFQWNPNNLSVTMLIIMPFFLLSPNTKVKYLGMLSVFSIIIMTGSRGVFIAFTFVLFLYMLVLSKKRFLIFSSILPIVLILFISNIDTLKQSQNSKIREMSYSFDVLMLYLGENTGGSDSIGVRQQLIINGLSALKASNYLGVGGGGSVLVQERTTENIDKPASMHHFWIEMLVDSGIVFTFIFVTWYIYILIKLYTIGIRTKNIRFKYYAQALFLSMSGFTIGTISASSVIYLLPMWLMFGFAIATINNYVRFTNKQTKNFKG
jgi:teichuronic acid biosynthesis protein TuaE